MARVHKDDEGMLLFILPTPISRSERPDHRALGVSGSRVCWLYGSTILSFGAWGF